MSLDEFAAAGLYDRDAPRADERRELLEHLASRFALDDIIAMAQQTPPYVIAASLAMEAPTFISARQAAVAAGVPIEDVRELRAALGWPVVDDDDASLPDTVVEDLALFALAKASFEPAAVNEFVRVLGAAVLRLIEAGRSMMSSSADREGRATELELSMANEVSNAAWNALPPLIGHVMTEHAGKELDFATRVNDADLRLGVVFVDLVAFTSWTASVSPAVHARVLARFERAAWEIAVAHGGRLVKLIGDEAMIVAPSAAAALQVATELVRFAAADGELPRATAAAGFGPVVARGGDYFGALVNLVARAISVAQANEVLVTEDVVGLLDAGAWRCVEKGTFDLKGVDAPVTLWRVEQASTPPN
ncbi:MAG TPA: adenylate cyclase regulatory domain-containing protein [Acidimicrobiales bacterium]|nr:adenylate cyclase regulatory domain-containing protein [Acidimicrobiales bacterium]